MRVKTCTVVGRSYGDLVSRLERVLGPSGRLPDIPSTAAWATVSLVGSGATVLSCYDARGGHLLTDQWDFLLYDLVPDGPEDRSVAEAEA